jgi:hypothetical protein
MPEFDAEFYLTVGLHTVQDGRANDGAPARIHSRAAITVLELLDEIQGPARYLQQGPDTRLRLVLSEQATRDAAAAKRGRSPVGNKARRHLAALARRALERLTDPLLSPLGGRDPRS